MLDENYFNREPQGIKIIQSLIDSSRGSLTIVLQCMDLDVRSRSFGWTAVDTVCLRLDGTFAVEFCPRSLWSMLRYLSPHFVFFSVTGVNSELAVRPLTRTVSITSKPKYFLNNFQQRLT